MMRAESDRVKIREFLDLVDNQNYDFRKYIKPVLVFKVEDYKVFYSLWEEDILGRYGLENVDGWDYAEDISFCPDWVVGEEITDLHDEDDDEDF